MILNIKDLKKIILEKIEEHTIHVECPNCKTEFKTTLSKLERDNNILCVSCDSTITVNVNRKELDKIM